MSKTGRKEGHLHLHLHLHRVAPMGRRAPGQTGCPVLPSVIAPRMEARNCSTSVRARAQPRRSAPGPHAVGKLNGKEERNQTQRTHVGEELVEAEGVGLGGVQLELHRLAIARSLRR